MTEIELSHALEIARPPAAVFEFLADTASFRAVDPALVEVSPAGPLALGRTGTFVHRRGGLTARTTWRVVELDAPRRLSVAIAGPGYAMEEFAELEATAGGTRVTFSDRVRSTSLLGRLLVALSPRIMQRDLEARASRLRTLLESAPPTPAA